jgi:hypothetical protein
MLAGSKRGLGKLGADKAADREDRKRPDCIMQGGD